MLKNLRVTTDDTLAVLLGCSRATLELQKWCWEEIMQFWGSNLGSAYTRHILQPFATSLNPQVCYALYPIMYCDSITLTSGKFTTVGETNENS